MERFKKLQEQLENTEFSINYYYDLDDYIDENKQHYDDMSEQLHQDVGYVAQNTMSVKKFKDLFDSRVVYELSHSWLDTQYTHDIEDVEVYVNEANAK